MSVNNSMRRRWVHHDGKHEDNTLELSNSKEMKHGDLDKSTWIMPVHESNLGKRERPTHDATKNTASQLDEEGSCSSGDKQIDSGRLNKLKSLQADLKKRQRISVDVDVQDMFDSKKMEEQMRQTIKKQLEGSMNLIERKIQKTMGMQFNKMWESALS